MILVVYANSSRFAIVIIAHVARLEIFGKSAVVIRSGPIKNLWQPKLLLWLTWNDRCMDSLVGG